MMRIVVGRRVLGEISLEQPSVQRENRAEGDKPRDRRVQLLDDLRESVAAAALAGT